MIMKYLKKIKMAETTIQGLSLMDYKDIEREALSSLNGGKKIVLASELMLEKAEKSIALLGGKTAEQEDAAARAERHRKSDDGSTEV